MKEEEFSDLHQHVLWGLDDGPRTPEEMQALLEQDWKEGIRLVFATTHAYPKERAFDLVRYRERLCEANDYCSGKGWPIILLAGCEIYYCDAVPDHLAAGRLPALGDSRRALIEFHPGVSLSEIGDAADRLYSAGYPPVLAHVERYRCLVRSPERAMEMREEYGLIYQMNCETVLQPRGFRERCFVRRMLAEHAIDAIATDAHDVLRRPVRMQEAYRKIADGQGEDFARQLVSLGWSLAGEGRAVTL
jgi:protein-tyrosine phosphatase